MKESDEQRAILDYLAMRRHFCWRNNSGAFKTEHGSFVRAGMRGSPTASAASRRLIAPRDICRPPFKSLLKFLLSIRKIALRFLDLEPGETGVGTFYWGGE
jgi:hypothetical protein